MVSWDRNPQHEERHLFSHMRNMQSMESYGIWDSYYISSGEYSRQGSIQLMQYGCYIPCPSDQEEEVCNTLGKGISQKPTGHFCL